MSGKAGKSGVGTRLTELRRSHASGKHGKTRKSQRGRGNAAAINESRQSLMPVASERNSLPVLIDRVVDLVSIDHHHEHEVRALCADIFRLGLAVARNETIKEYSGQIAALRQEVEDLTRWDGER